jgi:SAM-dependent methyltransferase
MALPKHPLPRMSIARALERANGRPARVFGARRGPLGRLWEQWRIVFRAAARHLLRLPTPLQGEDRRILEQVIFGYYAAHAATRSVLFVGCGSYAQGYERSYFRRHELWTLDPTAQAPRCGARQHIAAPLERLGDFFPEAYFDLIICKGVYGCGLDSYAQCEAAFGHIYTRLRPGGHLVLGWDDVAARTPVALENLPSLKRFHELLFPPLGTSRYLTDTSCRHTYAFYCR